MSRSLDVALHAAMILQLRHSRACSASNRGARVKGTGRNRLTSRLPTTRAELLDPLCTDAHEIQLTRHRYLSHRGMRPRSGSATEASFAFAPVLGSALTVVSIP